MRVWLPHSLTFCNVLCGILGIISIYEKSILSPFYWACLAASFDLFDGALARILRVTSEKGRLLDTLSDVVSFGVLPTLYTYFLIKALPVAAPWAYVSLVFILCAIWRLVDFTVNKCRTDFSGLPTPAAALFILSLDLLPSTPHLLIGLSIGVSGAMILPVQMLSLKFSHLRWRGNEERYIFLLISVTLFFFVREKIFLYIIPLYVLFSVLISQVRK